jgi:hypothetical protein
LFATEEFKVADMLKKALSKKVGQLEDKVMPAIEK